MVVVTAMGWLGPLLALAALLPLLTLTPLADVTLTESEPDNCSDRVVLFQLDSFRWKLDGNDSMKANQFLMQVTAHSTCESNFPANTVALLMDVTLVYTSKDNILVNAFGNGSFTNPTMTLYFPINVDTINFEKEVYYVVSAIFDFKQSPGKEREIARLTTWQPIEMNGAAMFAMKVAPGVIKGHYLEHLNLSRLSQAPNVTLNCTATDYDENVCYFLPGGQERQDVCVIQPSGVEDILICDDTVKFVTVSETTNLDSVQLLYTNGEVKITTTNHDTTLELYHFTDGTNEACGEPTSCNLPTPSTETYIFRMVELDGSGTPISSNEVLVQDFNVTTLGISSDTAQVSWNPGNSSEFNVTISPGPDAKFSGRVVSCNESPCDFFFIGLQGDNWQNYTITVRSVSEDYFASEVVTSLEGSPGEINSNMHNITELNHYTDDNYGNISTEACFEFNSEELGNARLLLIDSTGLSVQASGTVANDDNTTYCIGPADVPGEFITSDQTRILVDFLDNGDTFSTQMDIFLFTPDIEQVSKASARATWRNLNSAEFFTSRAPGQASQDGQQKLKCSYTGDQCNYYVNEDQTGSGNFSLLETSENLNQSTTVQLEMKKIPREIDIVTPFSIRHDDRLQVCFDAVPKVDRYELGIELLGELVSSDQDALNETVSGKTCAISSNPVTLGAYEELWAVVVAYDAKGAILSAGEKLYEDTYLSPNRFVLAVTSGSESPVTLKASWYILDDTTSFEFYNINLMDENGATLSPTAVVVPKTTSSFTIEKEGLYSVCVSVTTPKGFLSEQTCSDIVTVKFSTDSPDPIPMVANVRPFYTSEKKLKLSWDRPEDASALLVSWSGDTSRNSGRSERSLHSIETAKNLAFNPRKTEARESSPHESDVAAFSSRKVDFPLPQARCLQNTNHQSRRVVLPSITGDGFTLVPASQSSVDIPFESGNWNVCVSAVRNHQAGTDFCVKATMTDDSDLAVSPPTGLTISGGVLFWTPPLETLAGDDIYTYYIEFDGDSESISHNTNQTSLVLDEIVEAGQWEATVHSYSSSAELKRLSVGLTKTIVVNGIKVTYEQTGSRNVTLSWEEESNSIEDEEQTYIVTLVDVDSVNKTCSGGKGCSVTFGNVQADQSEELNVTVESNNGKKELLIYFLDIGIVPANTLKSVINANSSATVTWVCLEDVSLYNVSLVDKDDVVLKNDKQTMPCSYTFAESDLTTLQEESVLLQACVNSRSGLRCGDPQRLNLWPDVPGPTTDTSNVLVIVLSSVAAGLLLILMVAGLVYKLRSDRAKNTEGDDTSVGGGSVDLLKVSSGSQHSVEPPDGRQSTTSLQANAANTPSAQNPTQPLVQRQTPVQYRSAAPVSQMQPSNGLARQNPEAGRAPISSVNPNVRYGGPGPQRLPQVGNPPQRFSNPNVRATGPLRMNVPAGQPRMNNFPSGPSNFSDQPRNLPQGARMNRPQTSQPIEVLGRFSGQPVTTRPIPMSTRAPAPRPTGLQMSASPTRYPPSGQRSAPGPSSPTRHQAPPSGIRPIPRVGGGGGGGYIDMSPSPPGLRPTRNDTRQISPDRFVRQPQPQNPRGQVRNHPDNNRVNNDERIF